MTWSNQYLPIKFKWDSIGKAKTQKLYAEILVKDMESKAEEHFQSIVTKERNKNTWIFLLKM